MFPIRWNDIFRKKDGTLGTMENLGGGSSEIPSHTSADAGKVLTVGEDGELEWHESGGAGGVYVGTDNPSQDLGENGDYYYKRSSIKSLVTYSSFGTNTGQSGYGNEFLIKKAVTITAINVYLQGSFEGSLIIGDSTDVIETHALTASEAGWQTVSLTTPLEVDVNDVIIVKAVRTSGSNFNVTQSSSNYVTTDAADYVRAHYGSSYPGTNESGTYAPVSFTYDDNIYKVIEEFYKANGSWTVI